MISSMDRKQLRYDLYDKVVEFMKQNEITCKETIHQCDWVIESAYEFIGDLFEIVEPDLDINKDED